MLFPEFSDLIKLRGHSSRCLSNVNANSLYAGDARSQILGQGMEFAKVRPYEFGDDVRSIDWKVTARTNKAHSKIYQAQSDNITTVVVDLNLHMQFGTQKTFRYVVAAQAFALIGFHVLANHNRIAALIVGYGSSPIWLNPTKLESNFIRVLKTISTPKSYDSVERSSLSEAMVRYTSVLRKSNSMYIISDPYSFDEEVLHNISLMSTRCNCHIVDIQDPIDKELPLFDDINLVNKNKMITLRNTSKKEAEQYKKEWEQINNNINASRQRRSINRISLHTDSNNLLTLRKHLSKMV